MNAPQTEQSSPTSHSTAKRLAHLVALSRLTRGVVGGSFTLNTRIAFGHGCDRPSYVRRHGEWRSPRWQTLTEFAVSLQAGVASRPVHVTGCVGKCYGSGVQKTQCLLGLCRVLRVWPPKGRYVPSFILIIILIVISIGSHRVLWLISRLCPDSLPLAESHRIWPVSTRSHRLSPQTQVETSRASDFDTRTFSIYSYLQLPTLIYTKNFVRPLQLWN